MIILIETIVKVVKVRKLWFTNNRKSFACETCKFTTKMAKIIDIISITRNNSWQSIKCQLLYSHFTVGFHLLNFYVIENTHFFLKSNAFILRTYYDTFIFNTYKQTVQRWLPFCMVRFRRRKGFL